jgi:acetyl-CoA synthetase (ADP-forming)
MALNAHVIYSRRDLLRKGDSMTETKEALSAGSVRRSLEDFLRKAGGRKTLAEHEVKGFLKERGFPVPKGIFFTKDDPAVPVTDLQYPLVAKVSSAAITSKSDVHGVRVGLKNNAELAQAAKELLSIEGAEGVLVEEMAPQGLEVIVGGTIDPQFGPVVMFGLGGVFVELFRDVAFCLAPLAREDALWLMKQVKGYRLLQGYRGAPPADTEALISIFIGVSEVMATGLVSEIDLNPVSLYPRGAMVLDAKMFSVP